MLMHFFFDNQNAAHGCGKLIMIALNGFLVLSEMRCGGRQSYLARSQLDVN